MHAIRPFFHKVEPTSPQPSVDRLSVSFAPEERSVCSDSSVRVNVMAASGTLAANGYGDASPDKAAALGAEEDDEDYSVSISAIMQRRASTRRSKRASRHRRGSHARRPSSPFSPDADSASIGASGHQSRRRSSVFTTSSADTAASVEGSGGADGGVLPSAAVSQEQILENLRVHKEVLSGVKMQPWGMRRKLRLVRQAKTYVKRHEGQLHERFANSHNTRDIMARFNLWMLKRWQRGKREVANLLNMLIPWELRIKEIESHFGSVVASYFTFLRWLCWVNFVIVIVILAFVTVPEILTADSKSGGERKEMLPEERATAYNLYKLWDFEGPLKYSPLFYGYYTDDDRQKGYRLPFAYFMTGLAVYVYSFVATLRKMASNSRMSKLSEKEDECVFTWKLFAGWDYMIGNAETAHNRVASTVLGFKEALVEEAEKQREERNWRIMTVRVAVNLLVLGLLVSSAYAVVEVVARSTDDEATRNSVWRQNETTVVVTVVNNLFPLLFELLGILERYHPRKTLRLQLARIMALNLTNIYTLIFSMFKKINKMMCYVARCETPGGATGATSTATTPGAGASGTTPAAGGKGVPGDGQKRTSQFDLETRRRLHGLCWETMFGQEMVKMTVMDLVMTVGGTLFIDFFRAVFVRVMNNCWCWDLEKKFPQYGDFKIAENILHLVNNQGMVWMGMFFSPGLPLINLVKLAIMMYLRSWAVLTCNVPHEVVFRASRSNNFYLALLLTMLFLCVLPVGYAMVRLRPSVHCGPFSRYLHTADIFTNSLRNALPAFLHDALNYMASPGIVIPLLLLLFLVIYYLLSLTNSLREANNDLKIQLRRERTEERRKMFQIVDGRRGGGGDLADKWRRLTAALPSAGTPGTPDGDGKVPASAAAAKPETNRRKELLARLLKHALRKSSATSDEESMAQTPTDGPAARTQVAALAEQPDGDATDAEQPDCLPEDDEQAAKVAKRASRAARTSKARSNGGQGIRDAVHALTSSKAKDRAQPQPAGPPAAAHHPHHHHHYRRDRRERRERDSPSASSRREREDSVASSWSDNIPEIRISKTESSECVLDDSLLDGVLDGGPDSVPDDEAASTSRTTSGSAWSQAAEPQRPSKSGSSDTIVAVEDLANPTKDAGV
ncbi:transmembrane channel-like protein 2 [Thrips palmi]|uniref:Transmembrane channel-like protein 2 n=1 Tax=Thrips palmi TaxID=161013 RepID=A0A6P8Y034_THRPL|nr:transmembrane channel-like protein 2 [Thrips palmi]